MTMPLPNLLALSVEDVWGTEASPGPLVQLIPELQLLYGTLEKNTWHNNETTAAHTMQVCKNVPAILERSDMSGLRRRLMTSTVGGRSTADLFSYANVLHDIAKPMTQSIHLDESGVTRRSLYPGHEAMGELVTWKILGNLPEFTRDQTRWVAYIVRWHGDMHSFFGLRDEALFEAKRGAWMKAHPDHWRELFLHSWVDTLYGHLEVTNKAEYDLRLDRYAEILGDL